MNDSLRPGRPGTFALTIAACLCTSAASAATFDFSTGGANNLMAMASRPSNSGVFEIEAADDFVLTEGTQITSASFTGLLTGGASTADVSSVTIEIYRVFPQDSNTAATPKVPTRTNSPSDVAFDSRAQGAGLVYSSALINPSFTALNSIQPGGIHPEPNQTTGGDGPLTGQEVGFDITLNTPLDLPAGHYFFVPQVAVTGGDFYWLSASKPITSPGTPFIPDLQTWTRDDNLAPDWLRVGTDMVGGGPAPTFNAAFTLHGSTVPEPGNEALLLGGLIAVGLAARGRRCRGGVQLPSLARNSRAISSTPS